MKLIDISRPEEQLSSLASIDLKTSQWQEAAFSLPDLVNSNIVMLGRRLEQSLAGREGFVLIEGIDRLKVFINHDTSSSVPDFTAICSGLNCSISSQTATSEHIGACVERVERTLQGNRRIAPKSALFGHRKKRSKNVMMVADDDKLICAAMKSALGRFGECVIVHDAAEVLDAYLNSAPDSVFIDLHLAGGTGLEGIDSIMAYDRDAYIVMLTGDNTASHAAAAKARGAKSFVSKPIVLSRIEYELFRSPTFRPYGV